MGKVRLVEDFGRHTRAMEAEQKADLQRYLSSGRQALLWKLDGLSEYDMRRPMTPTGTNLLGLVKHRGDRAEPGLSTIPQALAALRHLAGEAQRAFPEAAPLRRTGSRARSSSAMRNCRSRKREFTERSSRVSVPRGEPADAAA